MQCLASRTMEVCNDRETTTQERENLKEPFLKSGYPYHVINETMRKKRVKDTNNEMEDQSPDDNKPPVCILPSIKGISEKIGRICRRGGVKVAFRGTDTLRSSLTKVKGTHKNSIKGDVYQIPCTDCDHVYIGETGQPFHLRLKEHRRAVVQGDQRTPHEIWP